jgi:prolyl 4-hydroxylase
MKTGRVHEKVLLAERHDAEGHHSAAIDALAQAAQSGDVEALTRLGKRLLGGDRAPLLPQPGADLLRQAAEAGGAEATEKLAVLSALAAPAFSVWTQALMLLARSAAAGWAAAQGQLMALSANRVLAARAAQTAAGTRPECFVRPTAAAQSSSIWQDLAQTVDLAWWLSACEGTSLHPSMSVKAYPGLLPPDVCDWVILHARPKLHRAEVFDAGSGSVEVHGVRTNTAARFDLVGTDLVNVAIQVRLGLACGHSLRNMEALSVLHYEPGEEFAPHFDFLDPTRPGSHEELSARGQRVATFLIYLNQGYSGGETNFPALAIRHKGTRGEGLCFLNTHPDGTPNSDMLHAGLAPLDQEKWVVSQFLRARPCL